MARIRTTKPCFFRHESLIDLEIHHGDLKPMLVFQALWSQADKNGVFEWKPRQLQLDILPFYWQETGRKLADTLAVLVKYNFISVLTDGAKVYGYVPTFKDHQRITGTEKTSAALFPDPDEMTEYCTQGNDGEAPRKQQGNTADSRKGMEEEGNGVVGNEKPTATKTEIAFLKTFAEKEDNLKNLFPNLNYEVEKETCLAHYRHRPPPVDPYVIIVKWFRRAQPDKPPIPTPQEYMQTADDLRAKGLIE